MATSLTSGINLVASVSSIEDGRTGSASIDGTRAFSNGTTAGKADKAYYKSHTIAASGSPVNLDFAGGGLIDVNGDAITWVDIVLLVVKSASANTVNILVGNATNPFDFGIGSTATKTVKPGEAPVLINVETDPGYAVTAGSADTLKLAIASGTNQVIEVLAIGRSA